MPLGSLLTTGYQTRHVRMNIAAKACQLLKSGGKAKFTSQTWLTIRQRHRLQASLIDYILTIWKFATSSQHGGDLGPTTKLERTLSSEISYAAASKDYKAGRYVESLTRLNKLIDNQKDARTFALLAKTLVKLDVKKEAADAFKFAASLSNIHKEDYLVEAQRLYFSIGDQDNVLAIGNKLFRRAQNDPEIAYMLAKTLLDRKLFKEASPFRRLLAESDKLEHAIMASALLLLNWNNNSTDHAATVRALMRKTPNNNGLRILFTDICRQVGNFELLEKQQKFIDEAVKNDQLDFLNVDFPFANIHWSGEERVNRRALLATNSVPPRAREFRRESFANHQWPAPGEKLRIGYVSSDMHESHAVNKLVRRVLELHDHDRFEIHIFCNTPEIALEANKADRSLWGNIVTIRGLDDPEAVVEIRNRNIDILVDLNSYTQDNRTNLANYPAAPVHVVWLGLAGPTIGVDYDYVIGDPFVLPDTSARWYDEKFCRLPECYQPNDCAHRPFPQPLTRKEVGLPEDAFVFGSFNANRKITAEMTRIWAEILKRTPNSVLWVMCKDLEVRDNLVRWFKTLGIAERRLYFMGGIPYALHLNRIPMADLGLDTYPFNGHTTCSEQLWSGLPVLTMKGTNFASRVSESLLSNIGLQDMVAEDTQGYIDMAVDFYEHPEKLLDMRRRIDRNRDMMPLFDAERFARHLERAYEMMADRARAGLGPEKFDVPALPPRTTPFQLGDGTVEFPSSLRRFEKTTSEGDEAAA